MWKPTTVGKKRKGNNKIMVNVLSLMTKSRHGCYKSGKIYNTTINIFEAARNSLHMAKSCHEEHAVGVLYPSNIMGLVIVSLPISSR